MARHGSERQYPLHPDSVLAAQSPRQTPPHSADIIPGGILRFTKATPGLLILAVTGLIIANRVSMIPQDEHPSPPLRVFAPQLPIISPIQPKVELVTGSKETGRLRKKLQGVH